jgi:hypothetical protein
LFLTGDDIARTPAELHNSITDQRAPQRIQYILNWAKGTRHVVGIDMVDEIDALWGNTPLPTDNAWSTRKPYGVPNTAFTSLMQIVNGVSGRPSMSFSPTGAANKQIVRNWQGDSAFSDFATMYWTFSGDEWMQLYPWAFSTHQVLYNMDRTLWDRLPVLQREKPLVMLTSLTGPYYIKKGRGNQYTAGQDQLVVAGNTPVSVSAQIMFAAAKGFAGIRAYGFDSAFNSNSRKHGEIGSRQQTFISPTEPVGIARWQGMSAAFNLLQTLEPYLLQPQANSIDLGSSVYTGAKDGPNGRLLIAVNSLETNQTIHADLSPYIYQTKSAIKRYRIRGATELSETLPEKKNDTLILEPGEAVVWLFRSSGSAGNSN